MIKQVIIVRKDLEMSAGKAMAQAAHASLNSYRNLLKNFKEGFGISSGWANDGDTKIVLACKSETELVKVINFAAGLGFPCALITDEGRTEFAEPTITCGAIGPWNDYEIDAITKRLRLY